MKKHKWMIAALVLAFLLFGTVLGFDAFKGRMIAKYLANMPEPKLPVAVVNVERRHWQPKISAIGIIEPVQGLELSASVSGLVKGIHFKSGEAVKAGELLLELDSDVEKANLASAKNRLPAARSKYQRNLKLFERGAVSQNTLDEAEATYRSLMADIASLEAIIDRREIRAPFDGITGLREVHLGQYLQPGTVITRVENIDQMQVRFIVPQKEMSVVKVGSPVTITTDVYPERVFEGQVSAIDAAVDAASGVIHLQATIPNSDRLLRVGMFSSLSILLEPEAAALVIPTRAIDFSLYGEQVYVVEKTTNDAGEQELRVQQHKVEVIERQGELTRVAGLQAGSMVVTSGQVRLHNGSLVKLVEDPVLGPGE